MYKYKKVDKHTSEGVSYETTHEVDSETEAGLLYGMQILNSIEEEDEELMGENIQH